LACRAFSSCRLVACDNWFCTPPDLPSTNAGHEYTNQVVRIRVFVRYSWTALHADLQMPWPVQLEKTVAARRDTLRGASLCVILPSLC
jgi:hypothetical protein